MLQIIPILGARTLSQLEDNLAFLDWTLSDTHLAKLDEVSTIDLGFPQDFLAENRFIYGDTYHLIDNHRPHMPIPVATRSKAQ